MQTFVGYAMSAITSELVVLAVPRWQHWCGADEPCKKCQFSNAALE